MFGCVQHASAIMWSDSICGDEVNNSAREDMDGMVVRVLFGKRMVIGYYICTLMCANLYCDKDLDRKFGEGVMSMS